ncbi:uncharacterized protein LOC129795293 isoform X2 [Lutzomyia longipalpis]|uniref:uncharacterized protein LOC129795293 isoform X2 n=1 Tax=Lutzomyia longipalpis TaxID=7200 RepID=UPI0024841E58|nr:uncharacterized protein LOC129795293 isoform X2 [Lutzomyia longipalpis]XP_055692374.1 uncharacterized protein LOC129795293 isoform X2 [Lutzomyia longipalpis]XP_055692375.1 uncharacterized protein LOC129795293 isoform X2 [Lutzomyia longipalpis]XP_055692376.1 uncharacterized protein LOC129795293 isoform X2 [Lutzomyia longipalpis]XP_055692377.1 uncharacterized protein LOC129795293 isoform X2 [Lutzomyia longipalpis]XP_055692378.1 uncharacterized protein LOC129795293 isoform X2 [Lutzomyia longip
MARQPAKSAGALLLATLATLVRLTVASSDYFSVSVDTGGDGNRVNLPKFGDRISPRHRYSGEERTSSAAVRANVTHLHRLTANDIIGRKSDEFTNEIDPPIFADSQIESNVSSAQAHRLEMSTEFFVVPPTVATMKPPSIRGVPTSLAGMIVTARTTAEAAGNATPPTIVPTHTIGLRKEGWVVPVLILSIITMITMVGFEVFVLCKVWRTSPSRRHLFLGQMLLLGLFACAGIAAIVTSRPTVVSCAIIRFGSGVAFALVFASLLVKCVFLISINGGVYLPYPYQGLLLLFAVLIQVAVSAQWLLTSPPEVIASPTTRYTILLASNTSPIQQSVHLCHTPFSEHLLSLIYVVFLILFVAVLAIKSRGIRDNYREATYIGLSIGGCIPIWLGWTLCGLAVAERHRDACLAFGLIATSATVFLVMFMPKGRQLAAMGKEGLYLEDREERCSSLSRTASGYSPSFFHFKPIKYGVMGNNNSGNSTAAAEGGRTGGGSNQNTKHQVIATLGGGLFMRPDDANVYTTLEQTLSSNPNVYFQRSGGVHPGMMY